MVGRIFVRNAPLLKLYALYASNHDRALGAIYEYSKKQPFSELLAACNASEECKHKVRGTIPHSYCPLDVVSDHPPRTPWNGRVTLCSRS